MNGNTIVILNTLEYLQSQSFVREEIQNFKWISRQLVKETLKKRYGWTLEIDTIQRHFRKLQLSGMVNYCKIEMKDCFQILKTSVSNFTGMIYSRDNIDTSFEKNQKEIERIFKYHSKNQVSIDLKTEYEEFLLYYENKKMEFKSYRFLKSLWKKWCININEYVDPVEKLFYDEKFKDIGSKKEFEHFKTHYQGLGTVIKEPLKLFESWVKTSKKFKSFTTTTSQKPKEQQEYKWNFKKVKDTSDKIKDWLEFEKGINWLDDYYWKGIPIPGIGWQKVIHPDFNKEEILLYKIDSENGSYLLNHKTDDVIEVEVLQND